MRWIFLAGAILSEVVATMSLRASDGGRVKKWFIGVTAGYLVAFVALSLALADGMALGVAYGIWGASGVALTAILWGTSGTAAAMAPEAQRGRAVGKLRRGRVRQVHGRQIMRHGRYPLPDRKARL